MILSNINACILWSQLLSHVTADHHHHHSMLEDAQNSHQHVHPDLREQIIHENDLLLEELIKSTRNMDELFDAHVEGGVGDNSNHRRRKRRQVNQEDIKEALCRDKNPGEFFRLVAGEVHCRDVVACADHGLQAIRCPPGLAFDLRKQTCEWKREVKDCNQKSRPKLSLPLYYTTEPVCQGRDEIACGDGTCLPR